MPRKRGLNKAKLDAIRVFVELYSSQNPYPPTIVEIMENCGFNSTSTTWRYVNQLVADGRLEKRKRNWRCTIVPGAQFVKSGSLDIQYPEMTLESWEALFEKTKRILLEYFPDEHGSLYFWKRRLKDPREIGQLARDVVQRAVNFEESFGERNAGLKNKKV